MTAPPSALRRLRQNELIVSILAVTSIIGWSASLAVKRRHWAQLSPAPLWKTKGGLKPVEPYASYAPGSDAKCNRKTCKSDAEAIYSVTCIQSNTYVILWQKL